ncbi:MAG: nuclear transport factor 2 family protein [Solirubrobacterales bacterium]
MAEDAAANAALIERFYSAFGRRDAEAMAACYRPDARFSDPAFGELRGEEVTSMWRMLCGRAEDLAVGFSDVETSGDRGSAHWWADYTFSTGRAVHNEIAASFRFEDGLIAEHDDRFGFWTWSRQALGPLGLALGWTPLLRAMVRRQALGGLRAFMAEDRTA